METRNPSGYLENTSVLAVFAGIGAYLSTFTPDELDMAVLSATIIAGKMGLVYLNNKLGGTLAESVLGMKPMAGAIIEPKKED